MRYFSKVFVVSLLLLVTLLQADFSQARAIDYIIDTDIGGDVDDVLALLVAINDVNLPLAVTTTHIEPVEKARIAKLILELTGHADIPVYAGIGTQRTDSRTVFLQQNPLWPPAFGYPEISANDKQWFPTQAVPYRTSFPKLFDAVKIESESAAAYIARIAKHYSPQNKLVIVALGPLHNISAALKLDPSIYDHIKIYAMGGVYPKGYNWLVSPETTAPILAKVETISVLSPLVNAYQFYITPQEFVELDTHATPALGKAILQDWKNWYQMDAQHPKPTHLSDPLTLYLALHPEVITTLQAKEISFPCLDENGQLKKEFYGLWYNMPGLEDKLMIVMNTTQSEALFVDGVDPANKIREIILSILRKSLN